MTDEQFHINERKREWDKIVKMNKEADACYGCYPKNPSVSLFTTKLNMEVSQWLRQQ